MKEVMEEGVSITTEKINKNNGVVMEGLVLKSENARVASIFYMEDYFSYWERGVPLEQLVRKVMWQFEHCKPQMDVEADFFQNYQEIKENICFKLINYERNRELLKKSRISESWIWRWYFIIGSRKMRQCRQPF